MRKTIAIGLVCLLALPAPSLAQTPRRTSSADTGSVFLQCDGRPAHRSGAELAGRLLLIMATAGIAGPGELADQEKRLSGAEGVKACDAALAREDDAIRKVQLTLARAIHHVEAREYDAALEDARAAPALAGEDAGSLGFRHSLLLSSLNIEAEILARLNRGAEAEAVAVRMADTSPYDVTNQQQASRFIGLSAAMTPEKQAYLDRLVRLLPVGLTARALAYQWEGRYADAAADYATLKTLAEAFAPASAPPQLPSQTALQSAMLALEGDMEKSSALAAQARALVNEMVASGKALTTQDTVTAAEEALDFQAIAAELAAGKAREARLHFGARSRWSVPPPPSVAALVEKLRASAPAEELTGMLAQEPSAIGSNALAARAGSLAQAANADTRLYALIRAPMSESDYTRFDDDTWDTRRSSFLQEKRAKDTYEGELVFSPAPGIAIGDALLLHCALIARSRGVAGFVLFPRRQELAGTLVRFGNPGDPGIPAEVTVDAAKVIADLSAEIPDPNIRRNRR